MLMVTVPPLLSVFIARRMNTNIRATLYVTVNRTVRRFGTRSRILKMPSRKSKEEEQFSLQTFTIYGTT